MTTYEHAMLGINGVLATGAHRRFSWKLVALAGVAAVAPDWDGLPMLVNMTAFEHGHRVWGHNVFACLVMALLLGSLDYHYDLIGRFARHLCRYERLRQIEPQANVIVERSFTRWFVWIAVAFLAALSQIPADAVVSGGKGLSDWALQPFWPVSNAKFVYSMVPWGNAGVTVIFAVGMLGQVRLPTRVQSIAIITLVAVVFYIILWGNIMR